MKKRFRSSGRGVARFAFLLALGLLLAPAFAPSTAIAGQTIIIDSDPGDHVYGNGDALNDGYWDGLDRADLKEPNNNRVTVNSNVTGDVRGAYGLGRALGNSVIINSSRVSFNVFGGDAWNNFDAATASGNTVTINGGTVSGHVRGGNAWSDFDVATASGNTVTINGGTVSGHVYGGNAGSTFGSATATHNTVTISGNTTFGAGSSLYGGQATGAGDAFTGNTLNVWNYGGSAVDGVQNFQFLNFVFPTTQTTVLTVTTRALLGDGTTGSTITASTLGGTAPLQPGKQITLIDGIINGDLASTQATGTHGATLLYNWTLDDSAGLKATLNSVTLNPRTKSLSEGRLAGLAFVGQGADLIVGQGMTSALLATQRQNVGLEAFGVMGGGTSRYDTGSHIDVDGFSLMAGLAWRAPLQTGSLVGGAFFEAGWGSYDSSNSFNNLPSVKGKGDLTYYGGGLLGRYEAPFGLYGEASLRAGRVDTDFRSNDILNANSNQTKYDSGSAYYGAHLGAGYVWKITDKAALDFSTKYLFTHQNSDSVRISGDTVQFKAANSQRWRTGAHFTYAASDKLTPYAGAYYDHEFGAKAKASTYGYAIDAPDLKGGTGVVELGVALKPSPTLPLSLDFGVQGYVGQREGVTGSLRARFQF